MTLSGPPPTPSWDSVIRNSIRRGLQFGKHGQKSPQTTAISKRVKSPKNFKEGKIPQKLFPKPYLKLHLLKSLSYSQLLIYQLLKLLLLFRKPYLKLHLLKFLSYSQLCPCLDALVPRPQDLLDSSLPLCLTLDY